ncbi:MAG: hypothetical protein M3Q40_04645 [Pseudomonadota bacterium]|nr:hypothetical protein [Pseudomonadota bacterium]
MAMRNTLFTAATALMAFTSPAAVAGPYADDLGKCLVAASTPEDKQGLVQWMFFAIALNPNTAPFATVAAEQREAADRRMADLMERLLTESCVEDAKKAVRYEGELAIKQSFGLLGQVAATEIFANPDVSAGSEKFVEYLDAEKLASTLGLAGQ